MPYVGNSPTANFASVTKDLFSGDGSTTAFTLSKAATTNGVAVFVENVRQEPTIAYAVSGTTLTFTAAPVTSSGNNIYVLHHNAPASTVTHPAAQALTATSGTFTTNIDVDGTANLDVVDIDGAVDMASTLGVSGVTALTNKLTVLASDGTVDNEFVVDIRNDEQTDDRSFGLRLAAGSTTTDRVLDVQNHAMDKVYLRVDGAGHVTMPNQSAFLVHPASEQSNIPIDAVADTIVFGTERFDLNGDFSSNTFTAPVTGKYQFNCQIWLGQVDSGTTYYQINLMTSNKTYYAIISGPAFGADADYWTLSNPVLADMDANDTAYMSILVHNTGTAQTDISTNSTFSGYLVA